jgi:hypothetical protein
MSKINGDKARQNLRDRKQGKMRLKSWALKAALTAAKTTAKSDDSLRA